MSTPHGRSHTWVSNRDCPWVYLCPNHKAIAEAAYGQPLDH